MEVKKYLHQHSNLVKYIEDWEKILFQRSHALYYEYMKHRKSLQHYIKKVDSLNKEMARLQKAAAKAAEENKEKPISPKKIEKLERNIGKLTGARETHDTSGEHLFLFLDEVVNRAWRDAFPLLHRTIHFDQDFSAMQAQMYLKLSGTIELLDLVGRNESASTTSRLQSLKTLHPEVMYSGEEMTSI
jgi:membrane-associated HD superfamily phosphohydrolase